MQGNEFLKFSELGSLYGLTFAVYLIMSGLFALGLLGERYLKLIALCVSIVLSTLFVLLTEPANAQAYVIGVVNAFMAFLAASGMSNVISAAKANRAGPVPAAPIVETDAEAPAARQWWERW